MDTVAIEDNAGRPKLGPHWYWPLDTYPEAWLFFISWRSAWWAK